MSSSSSSSSPFNKFVWFLGVVEDLADPMKASRVRVRCLGIHTEDLARVPCDTLPWAPVMIGAGVAMSSPMLLPGDYVIGFFLDGSEAQQPIVMGSVVGMPKMAADPSTGFNDPSGVYPKIIGKPTNSALARGELGETAIDWKNGSLAPGEPASPYNAIYPHNHVIETDGNHIIELDDTPGMERVHIFHRSGTFYEVHPDGKLVIRSVADAYEATLANKTLYVAGDLQIRVAGDASISTNGDLRLSAVGDVSIAVGGNFNVGALGSVSIVGAGSSTRINGENIPRGGANKAGWPELVEPTQQTKFKG